MLIRSALYAPGNVPKMLSTVGRAGADAVVLDLEDAVPRAEKKAARQMVREALVRIEGPIRYVRVNPALTGLLEDDLSAVVGPDLDGIFLPKVESAWELIQADALLRALEKQAGLKEGRIDLHPLFESAKGLMRSLDILEKAPARVGSAGLGAGDLRRDLGLVFGRKIWDSSGLDLIYARSHLVLACRAAGKLPPLDSVFGQVRDLEGLEQEAVRARSLGFQGKKAIHPAQVEIINRVFTPSAEEIAYARQVVAAFEAAEASGSASLMVGQDFVDVAVVEQARSVLARFGG